MSDNKIMHDIINNMEKVIVGKRAALELTVAALACNGHVLIEDVPGVGKTSLAATLAKSVNAKFRRVQFTPDIMPSDITGFSVYNQKLGEFEYREGAAMSNILLADEINRTSPKTQSSLLEVMEENQVTVDGQTYKIPQPFMVLATQNPVEYLGTYPLPEAQIDRFLAKITIGYPSKEDEKDILNRFRLDNPINNIGPVASTEDIVKLQKEVREVFVENSINGYIVDITTHTRRNREVELGASPRGSLALLKMAQAWALYNDRNFVIPEDVRKMAVSVLSHRIILKQEAKLKKYTGDMIVSEALESTRVPVLNK